MSKKSWVDKKKEKKFNKIETIDRITFPKFECDFLSNEFP